MVNDSCLIVLSRERNVAEPERQDKIYLHVYSHSIIIRILVLFTFYCYILVLFTFYSTILVHSIRELSD